MTNDFLKKSKIKGTSIELRLTYRKEFECRYLQLVRQVWVTTVARVCQITLSRSTAQASALPCDATH